MKNIFLALPLFLGLAILLAPSHCPGRPDDFPDMPAGSVQIFLPSSAAPEQGLALKIFYPATANRRYAEGAPVAVFAPGGHGAGNIPQKTEDEDANRYGYIIIYFLMPGGASGDIRSGGSYDYRGPDCQRALADVLLYASGASEDSDGQTIAKRVPFALTNNVGIIGSSNGGNLALTTLGFLGSELGAVKWFVAWESPIGDQTVTTELSTVEGQFNPYYIAGSSTVTECPWPGLDDVLAFDAHVPFVLIDPANNQPFSVNGVLFLDSNGNGVLDSTEISFHPLGGPGIISNGSHKPKAYTSFELAQAVDGQSSRIFGNNAPPPWLANRSEVESYWSSRDGSLQIGAAHTARPDLMVISLASFEDHVQRQPDHPHVRSHVQGWLAAAQPFVRVNPDAAYLSYVTGLAADNFPDNDANRELPYPGIEPYLVPEQADNIRLDPFLTPAATIELADRVYRGDLSANLDQVLITGW
jgi:hypothetical protein